MRFRFSAAGLLLAWLCATGGLLDVAQVFAWTRMFTGYVATLPVRQALQRTFDPAEPCSLCRALQKARAATSRHRPMATTKEFEKITLICQLVMLVLPAIPSVPWPAADAWHVPEVILPVPVPPPRGGRASQFI